MMAANDSEECPLDESRAIQILYATGLALFGIGLWLNLNATGDVALYVTIFGGGVVTFAIALNPVCRFMERLDGSQSEGKTETNLLSVVIVALTMVAVMIGFLMWK